MAMSDRQLTNREVADLADIVEHWGDAYDCTFDELVGVFRARYRGAVRGEDVTDTSVTELRKKIRHDYQFREGGLPHGD